MKKAISGVMVVVLLLTISPMFAVASDNALARVEKLIGKYFSYRDASYASGIDSTASSKSLSEVRDDIGSVTILLDEGVRQGKLRVEAKALNVTFVRARTTPFVAECIKNDGLVEAIVYAWTFIDYEDKGHLCTMGIGIWHRLKFSTDHGKIVLIQDDYDEGPGSYMRSSTYSDEQPVVAPTTWGGVTIDEQNMQVFQTSSVSSYNVQNMVTYADQWVWHGNDGYNHESAYNPAYKNFNPDGGDCANYESQCLSVGGIPQVAGAWEYKFNGPGTQDDSWSSSWISTTAHRTYFGGLGQIVDNPTANDIIPGNPIYMDWDDGKPASWQHTTICVGTNAAGTHLINCHNIDSWRRPWRYASTALYSTVKLVTSRPAFQSLTVTSPNGGESWEALSTQNITWTPGSVTGDVRIELSSNNGLNWQTITSSTPNDGHYSWYLGIISPTTQGKIRITSNMNTNSLDTSNSVFEIRRKPLVVTSPNGGENWEAHSTHDITWGLGSAVGGVKIELSRDNGLSWQTIVSSTPNDGHHSWYLGSTAPTTQAKVRITSLSDSVFTDMSDSVFVISDASK